MKFAPIAYKLSNGIPVILDPMDIATTGMTVSFGVGARDEAPHEYGITHFLEHMLCKGTQRFPSPRLLKDNVFVNGGESNASTSTDEMQFYGRMLAEKFHVLAESISDRLQNSLFDEKVLENERGVILDELGRSRNSMDNQFYRHTVENVLVNTGFAHPTLGTPENIKSFSRTQVIDYMRRNISAKNAIIGISGKIDNPDALISSLEKLYGWIPSIDVAAPVPITVTPTVAHKSSPGKENIKLGIGFQDVWPWGLKNRYANKCVSIFENTFSGRLYENIRNQAGLVYGIGMSSFGDEFVTVNTIDTECARDKIESVVAKIAKTVNEVMITKPVNDAELARARMVKKYNAANFIEDSAARKRMLINFYRQFGLVYDFAKDQKLLDKVSLSDVIKNSRDYFSKPISMITMGAELNADLKSVWMDNFKGR